MTTPCPPVDAGGSADTPRILRVGDHDAVVIKPAGMSVELPGVRADDALLGWVRRALDVGEAWLPHRLDRMARGIVVVALSRDAAAFHARMIAERRWQKHYLVRVAWTAGAPASRAGRGWDTLLGRHTAYLRERAGRAEVVRAGGRPSALEVLASADDPRHPGQAHMLIRLETGRFHQIRAMLAHLGAPIAGDVLYDVDAAARRDRPLLEHILLRHPRFDGAAVAASPDAPMELSFVADDPRRETIAPSLRAALLTLAAAPPASA